jgi:ParB/RepB/Spo0J family partition protein
MESRLAREDRLVELAELGEAHACLRVLEGESVRRMRDSLSKHGQLMAVAAYPARGGLEVVDGFKRLRAARELGWTQLRVRVLPVEPAQAKVAMSLLNHGRGLSELEEAWLVRSLYREDSLTQPEIGRLLGRHKSWVSRRLLLAEGLDEEVQAQVRLGLLATGTAIAVARLARGNQPGAAELARERGLTKHQMERVVTEVLARPEEECSRALAEAVARLTVTNSVSGPLPRAERTPAQWLMADIGALTRISARLQARLLERTLASLGESAAQLVLEGLKGLGPVLTTLGRTVERTLGDPTHAIVEDARGA